MTCITVLAGGLTSYSVRARETPTSRAPTRAALREPAVAEEADDGGRPAEELPPPLDEPGEDGLSLPPPPPVVVLPPKDGKLELLGMTVPLAEMTGPPPPTVSLVPGIEVNGAEGMPDSRGAPGDDGVPLLVELGIPPPPGAPPPGALGTLGVPDCGL